MWGVASTLAEMHAADPDRFAPFESMAAHVNPWDRNHDGLLVVPITLRNTDSQVR
jgi:hypothetical protein